MPLDRRQLLCGLLATTLAAPPSARADDGDAEFARLLDAFLDTTLDASPEVAAALGVDTGMRIGQRSKLDERSLKAIAGSKARMGAQLERLRKVDRARLGPADRISCDVILFCLQAADQANRRYDFGPGPSITPYIAAGAPYIVSPLTGTYSFIPNFLARQHPIGSSADAEAYLQRLSAFATAMDQEIETCRHDVAHGCTPPDFALEKTLQQMRSLRSPAPDRSELVSSFTGRAKAQGLRADYSNAATRIVAEKVYPALDRQIAFIEKLRPRATHEAGVWKFPKGDQYYRDSLLIWTSSMLDPVEIHRLGLAAVADQRSRMDEIMRRQGLVGGSVAQRIRAMFADPQFRYPNDESGKATLLADLNEKVGSVRARLPEYFGVLPKADVVVERIPQYMETARPSGYYQPPSLDNKRPGAFLINLRDTSETPSWILPNRTFHQSIPGHHLKFSLYQEARLPVLRKIDFYATYMEGWSAYASQLADEMGMYDDDPFGRIGYLYGALRTSVGLVADTGLHALRWSREQAISYFQEELGEPASSASTEVERYCIWPGQICTYLLDKQMILDLRAKARAALGPRFDIRRFHDAILLGGAVPHRVLATIIDDYIIAAGRG